MSNSEHRLHLRLLYKDTCIYAGSKPCPNAAKGATDLCVHSSKYTVKPTAFANCAERNSNGEFRVRGGISYAVHACVCV